MSIRIWCENVSGGEEGCVEIINGKRKGEVWVGVKGLGGEGGE